MNVNKISSIEAIALILILTINRLSISLPQDIILSWGSSSILNVIYISIIAIIITIIIIALIGTFNDNSIPSYSVNISFEFILAMIFFITSIPT